MYVFLFADNSSKNYDPFQYGKAPNPLQAHTVPSLQQMQLERQMQIQQQNYQQILNMGGTLPPTQEQIKTAWQQQIQGKTPPPNRQQQIEKEMVEILREVQKSEKGTQQNDYYHSQEYVKDVPNYTKARDLIKSMLDGKIPLSIKDAYYFEEASYGNLHLSYEEYNKVIKNNVTFIKQWLKENNYSLIDPEALHLGIQRFMSDTLYITTPNGKKGHLPYYYDYIDAIAKNDKRNYFATKTLATGGGQCNSLPIVYMILAEALGIPFNLAYNPQHTFIRYPNNDGTIVNYETTVGCTLPDAFFMDIVPTMAKAKHNNIFISSLNRQHIIAALLFDVALDFYGEHGLADGSFIKECMSIGKAYFQNEDYISTAYYNMQKVILANAFNSQIQAKKIQTLNEIEQYPDVLQAYKNYYGYMERIDALGVEGIPESDYLHLMEYYDTKGRLQTAKNANLKSKKSLFILNIKS